MNADPVAVFGRHPFIEVRFTDGSLFTRTDRRMVDGYLAARGWRVDWDRPRVISDGRTTWPLVCIKTFEVPA